MMNNHHPSMLYKGPIKMEYPPVKIEQHEHMHHPGMYPSSYLNVDLKVGYPNRKDYDYIGLPMPPHQLHAPAIPIVRPQSALNHNQNIQDHIHHNSESTPEQSADVPPKPPSELQSDPHTDSAVSIEKLPCEYCEKTFSTKGNLIVHKRTHTLEKPYICNQCGKSFTAKGNLNTHLLSHSEFRPFACVVCGKGFTTKGNLTVHMRSHSKDKPYECTICTKKFTTKGNLLTHSITHKEVKPFQCQYCSKQFSTNNNLIIHQRTHTQERPFNCSHCSKSFYSKGTLNAHFRTRHCEKNQVRADVRGEGLS